MSFLGLVERGAHGSEFLVTGLLLAGVLFLALTTGWFLVTKRTLPVRDLEPVEIVWYSREAEAVLLEVAPLFMALDERERTIEAYLRSVDASRAREVREAVRLTGVRELWSSFARASALVEDDPLRGVDELRRLRPMLRECVTSLDGLMDRLKLEVAEEKGEKNARS
ncbi:MAG TPA: hypothetical protein VFJ72_02090 [Rubrobacteraceae bacterium]|nr:hypothetical protein [Rubrobacteraceae bacterium]